MPKLFLSYGRTDGNEIAGRIKADLQAAGYLIWQDTAQIRPGHPWDEEIKLGLNDAIAAVALLTPHAVRTAISSEDQQDSVCLDEINYFRFQLKRPIIPVMAETCEPPLAIYRLEYVDMRTWRDDELYRSMFDKLLKAIEAALCGEVTYRSWISELSPWDFSSFLNEKRRDFCGREWVFKELEDWRTRRKEPALLIKGDAGAGKSAIVAELVNKNPAGQVLAFHCCQADVLTTLQPGQFVRNLAGMIAARNEEFAACLTNPDVADVLREANCMRDPSGAFEIGILNPLSGITAPSDAPRYIIIDALDESLAIQNTASPLTIVDVLATRLDRLPDWVRIVATTRKDPAVVDRMKGLRSWEIDAEDKRNLDDVSEYISLRLRRLADSSKVFKGGHRVQDIHKVLSDSSAGNFLYARQVLDGIERDLYEFDNLKHLPPGLYGLYLAFFNRQFPDEGQYNSVRPVLETMVAAREPLTELQMSATGFDVDEQLPRAMRRLLVYLRQIDKKYTFYHKSLSDWLADPELRGTLHYISPKRGHQRLADVLWAEFQQDVMQMSRFAIKHLCAHLVGAERWDELHHLLCDLRFIEAKCDAGMVHDLISDYISAGSALEAAGQFEQRRDIEEFARFVTVTAHLLSVTPRLTFQEAANLPGPSPVSDLAGQAWQSGRETRPWLDWINKRQGQGRCLMTLNGHASAITTCSISMLGDRIASGDQDGSLKIWSARTGAELMTLRGHNAAITCCQFSNDGKRIVSGSADETLRMWDAETGESLLIFKESHPVVTCAFSPDGLRLFSACANGSWNAWDALSGKKLQGRRGRQSTPMVFSSGGNLLLTAKHSVVYLWNTQTGRLLKEKGARYQVYQCAFSSDGSKVAVSAIADRSSALEIWDVEFKEQFYEIQDYAAFACAFSDDGQQICLAFFPNGLGIWKFTPEKQRSSLKDNSRYGTHLISPGVVLSGHIGATTCCAFWPDGRLLVSGSIDKAIKVWDVTEQSESVAQKEVQPGIPIGIRKCHALPDGRFLMLASTHHLYYTYAHVTARDNATGEISSLYSFSPQHMSGVQSLWAISPDGQQIACHVAYHFVLLDAKSGNVLADARYDNYIRACDFSADSSRLALLYDDRFILWNAASLEQISEIKGNWLSCAFSPDGRHIAKAGKQGSMEILDACDLKPVREVTVGSQDVRQIAYSPCGRRIVAALDHGTVSLWEGAQATSAVIFDSNHEDQLSCGFSPDGRLIAIVCEHSGEITLWSTKTHQAISTIKTSGNKIGDWAFSPSGEQFAWTELNMLTIWDVDKGNTQSVFYTRGLASTLAWTPDGQAIGIGDDLGVFYVLELRGYEPAPPVVTPVYLFRFDSDEWDEQPTARCTRCGNQFAVNIPAAPAIIKCPSCSGTFNLKSPAANVWKR